MIVGVPAKDVEASGWEIFEKKINASVFPHKYQCYFFKIWEVFDLFSTSVISLEWRFFSTAFRRNGVDTLVYWN